MSTKSARDCGLRRTLFGEVFSILAIGRVVATGDWGMDKLEFFSTWRSSRLNSFSSLGTKMRSGIGSLLPLPFCWNSKQKINNFGHFSLLSLTLASFSIVQLFSAAANALIPRINCSWQREPLPFISLKSSTILSAANQCSVWNEGKRNLIGAFEATSML